MSLEFPPQEITENDGPVVMARMAACTCEGSDVFHIFQIAGQDHFHVECVQCEEAYCPFNLCQMATRTPPCVGAYIDFQGAERSCIPGGEGCTRRGCPSTQTPSGGW